MTLQRRKLELFLPACCTFLAAALLYLLIAPIPEPELPEVTPVEMYYTRSASPVILTTPPKSAFNAIDAAPLFSVNRTPVMSVEEEQEILARSAQPPNIALIGIILDSETRLAMVKSSASPLAVSVSEGAEIDGWNVVQIAPDRIALRLGPRQIEIALNANQSASAATQTNASLRTPRSFSSNSSRLPSNSPFVVRTSPFTSRNTRSGPTPTNLPPGLSLYRPGMPAK